ncbi:uncharacterized protein HaLaN_13610, partial [Haematococcus lacustris]
LPGDPKLLISPQEPDKLAAFAITSLEKAPPREPLLPPDLGIHLSLLDVEQYAVPAEGPAALHPADLALIG